MSVKPDELPLPFAQPLSTADNRELPLPFVHPLGQDEDTPAAPPKPPRPPQKYAPVAAAFAFPSAAAAATGIWRSKASPPAPTRKPPPPQRCTAATQARQAAGVP